MTKKQLEELLGSYHSEISALYTGVPVDLGDYEKKLVAIVHKMGASIMDAQLGEGTKKQQKSYKTTLGKVRLNKKNK